jgi:putative ABC transport system permease protein
MTSHGAWMHDVWRDAAYAVRSFGRSRGFTAAAVLTVSLGIGAATAIFSVVHTVLLRPLPLADADRLVQIVENDRPRTMAGVNYGEYLEWQSRTTTLSGLAAASFNPQVVMSTPGGLVRMTGGFVTPNYFEVLGARAMLGRTLLSSDSANTDLMVLGFYAWRRHFAADPQVVGSVIHVRSGSLAGRSMTIVGVMPESMETVGSPFDFYTPIVPSPNMRTARLGTMIGRLRDGVSRAAASEEANTIGIAVRPPRPPSAPPLTKARFEARSLKDDVIATIRPALRLFLSAVAIVLLIVCANVANLVLARGTARRRELATRLALGASRGRLVRQLLAECAVLAGAGGILGGALGIAGVALVKRLATTDAQGVFRIVLGTNVLPRANEVGIDVRLFGITLAIVVVTTFAFGLLPALHLSRTNQLHAIGSRGGGTARGETRLRTLLVVAQLALATVLLVGAGLLSASFVNLATVDKGYNAANVLAFQLVLPGEYPTARKAESIEAVLRATRALPGVTAAGFAYAGIMVGIQDTVGWFVPPARTLEEVSKEVDRPRLKSLSAGYLEAVEVKLLDGRLIREGDAAHAPPAIVINQTLRRRYFGEASPVGAFMQWHPRSGDAIPVQVVGVIADVRQALLDREPYAEVFMDYRQVIAVQERWGAQKGQIDQLAFGFMSFAMRTRDDPAHVIPAVRQAVTRVDPNAALDAILPLDRLVASSVARQRFYAVMLSLFASVAALLAAIGVYGVLAYAVAERTREIGVRMALGATRQQVLALILRRGLLVASVGIAIGLAGAVAATRYLQAMLYGVTPLDVSAFAIVAFGFVAVAALASYLPARRATQVDPIAALRTE